MHNSGASRREGEKLCLRTIRDRHRPPTGRRERRPMTGSSGRSSIRRPQTQRKVRRLFLLNFCDRRDAANLGCGEVHFVAGVQVFGEAVLYFVLVDKG
jgi:hypothetical protein